MESRAFNETSDRSGNERGDQDQLTQIDNQPAEDRDGDRRIIDAVESNKQLLQQLLEQLTCLQEVVAAEEQLVGSKVESSQIAASEFDSESELLRDRIEELQDQVTELKQQNSDLASQVARLERSESGFDQWL